MTRSFGRWRVLALALASALVFGCRSRATSSSPEEPGAPPGADAAPGPDAVRSEDVPRSPDADNGAEAADPYEGTLAKHFLHDLTAGGHYNQSCTQCHHDNPDARGRGCTDCHSRLEGAFDQRLGVFVPKLKEVMHTSQSPSDKQGCRYCHDSPTSDGFWDCRQCHVGF